MPPGSFRQATATRKALHAAKACRLRLLLQGFDLLQDPSSRSGMPPPIMPPAPPGIMPPSPFSRRGRPSCRA
jgi:hypothetical protein